MKIIISICISVFALQLQAAEYLDCKIESLRRDLPASETYHTQFYLLKNQSVLATIYGGCYDGCESTASAHDQAFNLKVSNQNYQLQVSAQGSPLNYLQSGSDNSIQFENFMVRGSIACERKQTDVVFYSKYRYDPSQEMHTQLESPISYDDVLFQIDNPDSQFIGCYSGDAKAAAESVKKSVLKSGTPAPGYERFENSYPLDLQAEGSSTLKFTMTINDCSRLATEIVGGNPNDSYGEERVIEERDGGHLCVGFTPKQVKFELQPCQE